MSLFDHQKCHARCLLQVHSPVRYPYIFGVQSRGGEDRLVSTKIITSGQQEHRAMCLENWVKPERWQERLDRGEAVRCLKRLVSICKADLGLGVKLEGAFGGGGGLQAFFSSVQSLSRVRLFVTPWTAARQASLTITNSQSFCFLGSKKAAWRIETFYVMNLCSSWSFTEKKVSICENPISYELYK